MKWYWIKELGVFFLTLCLGIIAVKAQISRDSTVAYTHEIGLNQANFIVLVDKDENTYNLNYKYHFEKIAIRSALNFNYLNSNSKGKLAFDSFIGLEFKKDYERWQFFYGLDLSYGRTNYVESNQYINRYGVNPMIGVKYFIKERFSVTINPKLNLFYSNFRYPGSFLPNDNFDEFKVQIGGVSNFILSFHI